MPRINKDSINKDINNKKEDIPVVDNILHPYMTRSRCPNIIVDYNAIDNIGHDPVVEKVVKPQKSNKQSKALDILYRALLVQNIQSEISDNSSESDEEDD